MDAELREELAWLTRALRAHLEWSLECGTRAVPAADEAWIEKRREEYRRTELVLDPEPEAHASTSKGDANDSVTLVSAGATQGDSTAPHEKPAHAPPTSPGGPIPQGDPISSRRQTGIAGASVPETPAFSATPPRDRLEARRAPSHHSGEPAAARLNQQQGEASAVSSGLEQDQGPVTADSEPKPIDPQHRLRVLEETVRNCNRCGLHRERTQAVFARGTGSSGLVFVGEGPGADEDAQGYPFVGKAGQLLDRMIAAMGFDRNEVYVCNIVKCRPPNNRKPETDEIAACRPFVVEQLELIQPQVIVALGATAVQGLLGVTLGITRLRGQWRLYEGRIPVMPTFHPAYLLRQPTAKRLVWEDLQQVLKQMQLPLPPRR